MIVGFGCMLLPLCSVAESVVLHCTIGEVLTGTNGVVERYSLRRIIKVGAGIYETWSSKDAQWGENECALGRCTFNSKTFAYELNDVNDSNGYRLESRDQLTIDRATGHLTAEKKTSTTTRLTGYQAETTWYDEGTCISGADPAAP